jgi:DNA-binding beta-propeller fold protein YncE
MTMKALLAGATALLLAAAPAQGPGYHVTARHVIGGEGGWDYLTLDSVSHRLFITRGDRVIVVDPSTGKLIATIPGFDRAHGVAFVDAVGKAFATSGGDSAIRVIDLKTLKVTGTVPSQVDDDGIVYDPSSQLVFSMNGDAHSMTIVDPVHATNVANVPLTGKPEFGIADGAGHVYVNIEDNGEIDEVDIATRKVTRHWSMAPCKSPTGLAIDAAHHRLFAGCRSGVMAISDAVAGKLVTTVPIGQGVDATRFDAATQLAFASCGDGTISVLHEDSPDRYTVVQTVKTMAGARTMELDPATHTIYTAAPRSGARPAGGRGRPPMVPGSFTLLTIQR